MFASINPATEETLRTFEAHDSKAVERRLSKAASTFKEYRHTTYSQRSEWMTAAADLLEREKEKFAQIITLEMGKLLRGARDEVQKCATGCRFYAEKAAEFLADKAIPTSATRSYVRYEPLGAVLAVMPWNFPFWQVFRFAAPALMAGNVGLLKHAANVPQCALAIEDIFRRAGFPDGVFQTLLIDPEQTQNVIKDPRVKAVTLTGSERAGSEVASVAARHIKKSVLELGGNDPFIVMPSADLEAAISTGVAARTINTGQSCIAAKRFILADQVYESFLSGFAKRMRMPCVSAILWMKIPRLLRWRPKQSFAALIGKSEIRWRPARNCWSAENELSVQDSFMNRRS